MHLVFNVNAEVLGLEYGNTTERVDALVGTLI